MSIEFDIEKISEAVEYWNLKTSVEMAVTEEMGELLTAMSKYRRHIGEQEYYDNLMEEVRDNFIGLAMLMYKYGFFSVKMNKMINEKLSRKK